MNALGMIFFTIIFLFSLSGSSQKQTILFDQLAEIEYVDANKNGKMDVYENPDGTDLEIATDYLGNPVNREKVLPGPFQNIEANTNVFWIWPKR